jgi:flagellar basal body rod protein FlgC
MAKKMTIKKLQEFFENNDFNVHLTKQDGVQCAEVEKWTDGGVDMVIWLSPFTAEEFKGYVKDFDVDEQIDLYRQDKLYKANFTITESVEDFTNFHNHLKEIAEKL